MTETMIEEARALVAEAAGAVVTPEEIRDAEDAAQRVELERRRQSFSVEAVAGDSAALAALDKVEAEIAALDRQGALRKLAAAETAAREKAAAEAEAEARREVWRKEKADAEVRRDAAFVKVERLITQALSAAKDGLEASSSAMTLAKKLDVHPGPDYIMLVENRLLRRIHEELGPVFGVKPGIVIGREGREPLAVPKKK